MADKKQAVVVCDHDPRVLARLLVKARAWELDSMLGWADGIARMHGFAGVTVGCEPTGHRWMVLDQLAAQHGMTLVCVNPMLVGRAGREHPRWALTRDERAQHAENRRRVVR